MSIPIRCTIAGCTRVIRVTREQAAERYFNKLSPSMDAALIDLGVKNNCCRKTIMATVDLNTIYLHYQSMDSVVPLDFPKNIVPFKREPKMVILK